MNHVRYDDLGIATAFDAVRARRQEALVPWCDRVATHMASKGVAGRPKLVVDLGSGTGIWSEAIARQCDVAVVGVEPSHSMRRRAAATRRRRSVYYVGGRAEEIPLKSEVASGIWLSTVLAHFDHLDVAVAEMRRVLVPGALVMIRGSYPGRQDEIELFHHFPTAMLRAESWPRLGEVISAFESVGFDCLSLDRVREVVFDTYDEFIAMLPMMRETDSALVGIDDAEWRQGLESIVRERDAGERPWLLGLDLLVLRRR